MQSQDLMWKQHIEGLLLRYTTKLDEGCWLWSGRVDKDGYATSNAGRRILGTTRTHRALYLILVGPIPDGLELDHLCKNRRCVNPEHMEPVTRAVNVKRAENAGRNQVTCIRGHPFSPENTYIFPPHSSHAGERLCRECSRIRARKARR